MSDQTDRIEKQTKLERTECIFPVARNLPLQRPCGDITSSERTKTWHHTPMSTVLGFNMECGDEEEPNEGETEACAARAGDREGDNEGEV